MDAAIVELDALPDPVRTAAQDHDLRFAACRGMIRCVIGREIIGCVFNAADRDCLPALDHTQSGPLLADLVFGNLQQFRQISVRKSVLLSLDQKSIRETAAFVREELFFKNHKFLHLFQEIGLDIGHFIELFDVCAFAQGLVQNKLAFTGGLRQHGHQFLQGTLIEVLGKAQAISADFKGTDGLLYGFFIVLADAHDFAHRPHLGAKLVDGARELFKGPAGEFDDHIIP